MAKKITIPELDFWDEEKERFIVTKKVQLLVEHSLFSISKWEQKWHKPFLTTKLSDEEMADYIRCMTMSPSNLEEDFFLTLPSFVVKEIQDYINDPMSATWFSDRQKTVGGSKKQEVITAELVYYWMLKCGIPFEADKWPFNKLITLIRVYNLKESTGNKGSMMSKEETLRYNYELNKKRREAMRESKKVD